MGLKIRWTQTATEDLANVLSYLESDWPLSVGKNFRDNLRTNLDLIIQFPDMGEPFQEDGYVVRKILITKHNALFYEVIDEEIAILKIVDTRSSRYF